MGGYISIQENNIKNDLKIIRKSKGREIVLLKLKKGGWECEDIY